MMNANEHIAEAERLLAMDNDWANSWYSKASMRAQRATAHIAMATYLDKKTNPRDIEILGPN